MSESINLCLDAHGIRACVMLTQESLAELMELHAGSQDFVHWRCHKPAVKRYYHVCEYNATSSSVISD
jgi:hypothetical protein